jgi:hypothetical protein
MADNFRIKIEDLEGNGSLHGSSEEKEQSSALPNKEPASGSQSFNGGKLQSNSSGNTSIALESNSSSFTRDVSKESFDTDIHTDIYSEDPAQAYNLNESDAEYAEMIAALGDAYGKIFNIDAEDANKTADTEGLGLYGKTLDPNKMNALAKQLIYGTLKEVLSDMNANGSSTSPGSNDGGSGNGTGDGYSGINEDGSNSSNSATKPFDINIPISDLGDGTDPYVEVLPAIDDAIDELYSTEVDYQATNENVDATDILDKNPSYGKVENIEADLDHTGKWDLRAMPDAMSNMYDVYFRIVDNDTDVDGKHLTPGLPGVDSLFSSRLLSARISSIEIPAYERQTTEVSAWGGKIERPTDAINTPGQSSFSIRGDTRLLYIDFMNIMSGTPMADYLNVGSAVFDLKDKLSCSRTANYIKEAGEDAKKAKEDMEKAIAAIKKKEDEDLQAARDQIINEYSSNLKDETQRNEFMRQAYERSVKSGVPMYAAELEMIEEAGNAQVAELKKKLREVKAKENDGGADNYWAAQKEKKNQMAEIKAEIKKLEKEQEARAKKISDVTKEASKSLRNAKIKKNATVISAYLRNRPVAVEQNWTEASAYVTGAIARNMSIRGTAAPFSSFEDLSKHSRVDIIVRRVPQGERFNSLATPKKDERFIFEDVKLLGTSNGIQFKRESADTQDFTYNFIYKRFYKLDYYADDPADWVNSQLDSLANWCVDWTNEKIKDGSSALKSLLKG